MRCTLCRKIAHHALAAYAHVRTLHVALRAVLRTVGQLHHYRLVAVESQNVVGGVVATVDHHRHRPLVRGFLLPRPRSNVRGVPRSLHAAADQGARSGRVVMGIPLEQLPAVRHIVEGGALCRARIVRVLAELQSKRQVHCQCGDGGSLNTARRASPSASHLRRKIGRERESDVISQLQRAFRPF